MNQPSFSPRLPDHVRRASWIDPADVDWLSTGFSLMSLETRQHVIDACFTRQRQRVFDLMHDDPVGAALLKMYMNDDILDPPSQT